MFFDTDYAKVRVQNGERFLERKLYVTKSLKTGRKSTKTDTVHSISIRLFRYPYFQQQS